MKEKFKANIFIIIGISLVLITAELFLDWKYLSLIGLGFILLTGSILIQNIIFHRILKYLGLFCVFLSLFMLKSFYILLLVLLLFFILFNTESGHEFFHFQEAWISPKKNKYHAIRFIRPQSQNRTLLKNQSLFDMIQNHHNEFEWDDVNLVYFGGNNILDFGNTVVPHRETTIVIRKIFGRTRIIIPNNLGLRINFSCISGYLFFEANQYHLVGENFQWQSPGYEEEQRQINLIISVFFGNVEVILI